MGAQNIKRKFWTTSELLKAGKSRHSVTRAVRDGVIHRVGHGLYSADEPTDDIRLEALVHQHPELVFSGETAAHLHGWAEMQWPAQGVLPKCRTSDGGARLTVTQRKFSRTVTVRGLPVTTPLQTVVDLHRQGWPKEKLRACLVRAYRGAKGNDNRAEDMAALMPQSRGIAETLLDGLVTGTASNLERQVVDRLRTALADTGVTIEVNRKVRGYRFDIVIPEAKVLIEIDSYIYHAANGANLGERTFIIDRWKGNMAARWGWMLLRYPDLCVQIIPGMVTDEIVDTVRYNLRHRRGRRLRTALEKLWTDMEVWLWHPSLR